MTLTPYPDIDLLLGELRAHLLNALGDKLVGLYLYGSLVTGDFDRRSSDMDLLAVTRANIDAHDFDVLTQAHQAFTTAHPDWDGHVEIAYVSLNALKTFRTQASPIGMMSPGEPFHIKEVDRKYLMNWWVVREYGVALYGPAPATLIDPISTDEFVANVREHAAMWGEWVKDMRHRGGQAYSILTMCRALYAVRNRKQVSKKQAAEWAAKAYPQWAGLIHEALVWRADWTNETVDPATTF
ncbi:MAG TPA: aminoglycoside adenylyltransferase domain-containing protein, partial [Anaerolineae bacterium]